MIDKPRRGRSSAKRQENQSEQETQQQQLATSICDKKVVTNLSTDRQKATAKEDNDRKRERDREREAA